MSTRGKKSKPLLLPQTSFPARPVEQNLLEKSLLEAWKKGALLDSLRKRRRDNPTFALLDGPPYPTGHIDWTLFLNKTLKDIHLRWRWLKGYNVQFPVGWDCHGLPIELEVERELKKKSSAELSSVELRDHCRKYAEKFSKIQREEFIRSGILADWDRAYYTMSPDYEASVLKALAELSERDLLYRESRPAYWCPSCQTALSDFETVNFLRTSPVAFLSFPLISDPLKISREFQNREIDLIVFKKNLWLLPAVSGMGVLEEDKYLLIQRGRRFYLIGERYLQRNKREINFKNWRVIAKIYGRDLVGMTCRNPLLHRSLPILPWTGKRPVDGTGFIPLAPGHNPQHFAIYRDTAVEKLSVLDARGKYLSDAGLWKGVKALEAEGRILYHLKRMEALLSSPLNTQTQPYPHCWRCLHPLISRLIPQWFIRWRPELVDRAFHQITSTPSAVKEKLQKLLRERSHWSISRQRVWGVPLPFFYCTRCDTPLFTPQWLREVSEQVLKYGSSDFWFERDVEALLELFNSGSRPIRCPNCGNDKFKKGNEIIDVWFDSGIAALFLKDFFAHSGKLSAPDQTESTERTDNNRHTGSDSYGETRQFQQSERPEPDRDSSPWRANSRRCGSSTQGKFSNFGRSEKTEGDLPKLHRPPLFDACFESRKQVNGWFQSLFLSTVLLGEALPYRHLLAHYSVEIPEKQASGENSPFDLPPAEAIQRWGVEPFRLWSANVSWFQKVVPSASKFSALQSELKKIRNIYRYIIGNLRDFNPLKNSLPLSELNALDQIVLSEFRSIIRQIDREYERWNFRRIWSKFFNFFIDLSKYYLSSVRTVLYAYPEDSPRRRSVQTLLFILASEGTVAIAPILSFFAEEFWWYLRREVAPNLPESVHLSDWPSLSTPREQLKLNRYWPNFRQFSKRVRSAISNFTASHRKESRQLKLTLQLHQNEYFHLCSFLKGELTYIFDVAEVQLLATADKKDGERASANRTDGEKRAKTKNQSHLEDQFSIQIQLSEISTCQRCHRPLAPSEKPELFCPQCL